MTKTAQLLFQTTAPLTTSPKHYHLSNLLVLALGPLARIHNGKVHLSVHGLISVTTRSTGF